MNIHKRLNNRLSRKTNKRLDAKGEKSFQRFLAMVADYIQSIGDLEKSYERI